jgi:hypothetical protein
LQKLALPPLAGTAHGFFGAWMGGCRLERQNKNIAGVFPRTYSHDGKIGIILIGHIFVTVHAHIDNTVTQRMIKFLDKNTFPADFVKRLVKNRIAGCFHGDNLDFDFGVMCCYGVCDKLCLNYGKPAFPCAYPHQLIHQCNPFTHIDDQGPCPDARRPRRNNGLPPVFG